MITVELNALPSDARVRTSAALRLVRLLTTASWCALSACVDTDAPELPSQLAVPIRGSITGVAAAASSDQLLVWSSATGELLLKSEAEKWSPLGATLIGFRPLAAGFAAGEREVEVLDARGPQVVRLAADGEVRFRRPLRPSFRVLAGVLIDSTWHLGGVDSLGRSVFAVAEFGAEQVVGSPMLTTTGDSLRGPFHLSHSESQVILASWLHAPFRSGTVVKGARLQPSSASSLEVAPELADTSRRWVALPMFRSTRGFVQSYSDLRSDRRLHLLLSGQGDARRASDDLRPFGIAGVHARSGRLLGVVTDPAATIVALQLDTVFARP
jgi:hypothetical protein